jgi:hypothetical protein
MSSSLTRLFILSRGSLTFDISFLSYECKNEFTLEAEMLDYQLPGQNNAKSKHCNVLFYKHVSSKQETFMHTPRQEQQSKAKL